MKKFVQSESGATSIEYALIAGLLSIVIITTLTSMGPTLKSVYDALEVGLASVVG
jgi:pilus assembly protein Flp/PilA